MNEKEPNSHLIYTIPRTSDFFLKEVRGHDNRDVNTQNANQKSNTVEEDRGWTPKSNLLLLVWMSRCLYLLRSHYGRMRKAKIGFIILTITYVVVSTFSSSLSFFNVGSEVSQTPPGIKNRPITIVIGICTILSAMIAGILAFLKLGEIIGNERYAITKVSKMVREIEMVIYSDVEERPLAKDFLSRISEKYYKYHTVGDVLEEHISDWKHRLEEATKMNNSVFPDFEIDLNSNDIEQDGRITISDNVIKNLQNARRSSICTIPQKDPNVK